MGVDVGTLVPGKYADLLVVAGDPLTEAGLLETPDDFQLVLKGGAAFVDRLT